jgi:hypothetical protein
MGKRWHHETKQFLDDSHPDIKKQDAEDSEYRKLLMSVDPHHVKQEHQDKITKMHDSLVAKRGDGWCKCFKCNTRKRKALKEAYHIVGKMKGKAFASKSHLTKISAEKEHGRLKAAGLTDSKVVDLKSLDEDAVPVNAAGAGGIAGIGTGPYPQSEPGVPKDRKKALKVILNKAKMLSRTK